MAFIVKTPWPYTFKLRYAHQTISQAISFLCRKQGEGFGPRWSKMLYGAIPTRLNTGDARFNDLSNVTFQSFDNLHSGGMAASVGTDNSRYQYAMGVYGGDAREFCLTPAPEEIKKTTAGIAIPVEQRIMQIVPWVIPPTTAATTGGPATPTATPSDNGDLDQDEECWFVYTAITSGQESPPSGPCYGLVPANNGSIVLDWPAVTGATGYKLYGYHAKKPATALGLAGYDATKLGFIRLESDAGRQTSLGLKRFEYTGDTITPGKPPASAVGTNPAAIPKVLVFTCDATKTYCYLATSGVGAPTYDLQEFADHDVGGSPDVPSLDGTIKPNSIVQWGDELLVPTYKFGGTETVRRVFWDQSKVASGGNQQKMRVSKMSFRAEFLYADGSRRLWRSIDHQMYWCADPLAGKQEWTGPMNVGARSFPIGAVRVFGGTAGDAATYVSKGDGLWRCLETADGPSKFFERVAALGLPAVGTGDIMIEHAGQLFISGYRDLFRHTIGVLDSAHPNKDEGLPGTLDGLIGAMVSTGRHLYALTGIQGGIRPAFMQILETKQGEVWHQVFCSDHSDGMNPGVEGIDLTGLSTINANCIWRGQAMTLVGQAFTDGERAYLYFGGGINANQLWRIPVRLGHERLRQAPGYAPIVSGRLHFPPFYGAKPAVNKTWLWAELAQSRETIPNEATLIVSGEMLFNQAPTQKDIIAEIVSSTDGATPPGDFSPDRLYMTLGTSDIPDWTSNGISFDVLLQNTKPGSPTPVFGAFGFSFIEKSVALSRWTYNVEVAFEQKLPDATIDPQTESLSQTLQQLQYLEQFAATGGPLVLTHEDGNEYIVRIDLGLISPTRWEHRMEHGTGAQSYVEPSTTIIQVICTELFDSGKRQSDGTWIG